MVAIPVSVPVVVEEVVVEVVVVAVIVVVKLLKLLKTPDVPPNQTKETRPAPGFLIPNYASSATVSTASSSCPLRLNQRVARLPRLSR
jgi:hypothetical protein